MIHRHLYNQKVLSDCRKSTDTIQVVIVYLTAYKVRIRINLIMSLTI